MDWGQKRIISGKQQKKEKKNNIRTPKGVF